MILPRELWLIILKIKTRNAVKERLEKTLKFPIFTQKYCFDQSNVNSYMFIYNFKCGEKLYWHIYLTKSKINNVVLLVTRKMTYLPYKNCSYKVVLDYK